jgi:hypothetical protein
MSRPAMPSRFHDAVIVSATTGPRRECSLELDLRSARISDPSLPDRGRLRFGGIVNMSDVTTWRSEVMSLPPRRIDEVRAFGRPGRGGTRRFLVELDDGPDLEVTCTKVSFYAATAS